MIPQKERIRQNLTTIPQNGRKKFVLYPISIRATIPKSPGATCSSRAEVERKPLFLSRYCHYRAAIKGSFFLLFFLFLRPMNRGLTNRVNCPRKAGRVIISFGMKIGTDRFNKRIKIYSILFTSTLFSVSTTFFHLIGDWSRSLSF